MISNEVQISLFIITTIFICFSVFVIFKNLQSGEQVLHQFKQKRCDLNTISKLLDHCCQAQLSIYTFLILEILQ